MLMDLHFYKGVPSIKSCIVTNIHPILSDKRKRAWKCLLH